MFKLTTELRFADEGEPDEFGQADFAYHGWNFEISSGAVLFKVRTYDDEPGQCTVIYPVDALVLPEAAGLVAFVRERLGISRFRFCRAGGYQFVNPETLRFEEA